MKTATLKITVPRVYVTDDERALISPEARRSIVDWAHTHVVSAEGPFVPPGGRLAFDVSRFPIQREIIASQEDRRWSERVIVAAAQSGKTLAGIVIPILHALAHGKNALYMHASYSMAQNFYETKLLPMLRASPTLSKLIPERKDDIGKQGLRKFTNGTFLYLAGAESVGALTSLSFPFVVCDDVHAMPPAVAHHGHPIEQAKRRQGSFADSQRTTIIVGTAALESDYHWRALCDSTFYRPYLPCLECGAYQLVTWEQMRYPADDPVAAYGETTLECLGCKRQIPQGELRDMLARYRWASTAGEAWEKPSLILPDDAPLYPESRIKTKRCGFWYDSLVWPKTNWGSVAVEMIGADDEKRNTIRQLQLALPLKTSATSLAAPVNLETNIGTHQWGELPREPGLVIVLTADPGGGYAWYEVDAWQPLTGKSWVIEFGRRGSKVSELDEDAAAQARVAGLLDGLAQLRAKAAEGWGGLRPTLCLIDRGYQTEIVDEFCAAAGRHWLPTDGSIKAAGKSAIWPGFEAGKERPTPHGPKVYFDVNTNSAKLKLHELLRAPGARLLPADTPPQMLAILGKHLAAERFDDANNRWVALTRANHLLDCGALQVVGATAIGASLTVQLSGAEAPVAPKRDARPARKPDSRPINRTPFRRRY